MLLLLEEIVASRAGPHVGPETTIKSLNIYCISSNLWMLPAVTYGYFRIFVLNINTIIVDFINND